MIAVFGTRRRADEFAAALDAPHRDVDAELRALVEVVGSLRTAVAEDPLASPRDEFAAELRARLMAEAAEVLQPGSPLALPSPPVGRRERRLVAAAAAVVLVGGTAGVAAASSGALPGDPLYPIKRGIERAEAGLSVSSAGRGRDLLHQASGRLTEVEGLLASDRLEDEPRVPEALGDFVAQAEEGAELLLGSFQENRDPASVTEVRTFTADALADLETIAETAPASLQSDLREAAVALRAIDVRAARLCDLCAAGTPALELPAIFLASAEADRALDDLDADALDNSHPFVVPKSLTPTGRDGGASESGSGDGDSHGSRDTGDSPGGSGGGSTGGAIDPTDPLPSDPTSPAPRLPGDGSGTGLDDTVDGLGDAVGDTAGEITDGLTGAVETVLPDPVTGGTGGLLP